MKKLILFTLLILAISLSAIETDKILHYTCSAGIYSVSYDFLNTTSLNMDSVEGFSFWLALGTGIGKEFYDVSQGGIFDEYDICYNIGGILTSIAFKRYIRHREYKQFMIMLGRNKAGVKVRW